MPQHVIARYDERVANNWNIIRDKKMKRKIKARKKLDNDLNRLPIKDEQGNLIQYREHDINIASHTNGRDVERILTGHSKDGSVLYDYIYYTPNHYYDFIHLIPK